MIGPVAWCAHPRARHMHGTAVAYMRDSCRCDACREANTRARKTSHHRARRDRGRFVDAGPARAHVSRLLQVMTASQIAAHAGVSSHTVAALVGQRQRSPQKRITRQVEAKILAVRPARVTSGERALVDGTGTRRRVQALIACGWDQRSICATAGVSEVTTHRALAGYRVTARTRDRIIAAYDQLWDKAPDTSTDVLRYVVARTLAFAARRRFAPPLLWDDDTIDDPAARPYFQRRDDRVRAA